MAGFNYKGFKTTNPEKDMESGITTIKVINSADYITVESSEDLIDLEDKFKITINKYLKKCESEERNPYLE